MLEIELITTKKKLTLHLIKQMLTLPQDRDSMTRCEVLGFIKHPGIANDGLKTAVLLLDEEYYTLTLYPWDKHNERSVYVKTKSGYRRKQFMTPSKRDTWLELFELIRAKALKTHIYL